jgi:hypothetical protein
MPFAAGIGGVTAPTQEIYVQGESTVDDLIKAMGGPGASGTA